MSPERQRIVLAQFEGYEVFTAPDSKLVMSKNRSGGQWLELPDYLNDLNPIHKVIRSLNAGDACRYFWILRRLIDDDEEEIPKHVGSWHWRDVEMVFNATAAQCSEAFVKVIGKWEDKKV